MTTSSDSGEVPPNAPRAEVLQAFDEANNLVLVVFDDANDLVWMNKRGRESLVSPERAFDSSFVLDVLGPDELARMAGGHLRAQTCFHSFMADDGSAIHVSLAEIEPDATSAQDVAAALVAGHGANVTVPIAQRMIPPHFGSPVVVVWANDELELFGDPQSNSDDEPLAPPFVWERMRRDGQPLSISDLSTLPEPFRSNALDRDFRSLWALPLPHPNNTPSVGCLLVWTRIDLPPVLGIAELLQGCAQMLSLAVMTDLSTRFLTAAAECDSLTGLLNRRGFEKRVRAQTESFAAMYLDLDDFKPINDRFGHHVGDLVLAEVGRRLSDNVRQLDVVARLGGDEFAVMCTGLTNPGRIFEIADRLLHAVREPMNFDGLELCVSVSIGTAVMQPGDASTFERADEALIAAKRAGKAQVLARTA